MRLYIRLYTYPYIPVYKHVSTHVLSHIHAHVHACVCTHVFAQRMLLANAKRRKFVRMKASACELQRRVNTLRYRTFVSNGHKHARSHGRTHTRMHARTHARTHTHAQVSERIRTVTCVRTGCRGDAGTHATGHSATARHGTAQHGTARHGTVRHGTAQYGAHCLGRDVLEARHARNIRNRTHGTGCTARAARDTCT